MVVVAEVSQEALVAFQEYESMVLPLIDRYGGRTERRLRTPDSLVEVHIVSFTSRDDYASYLADPERMSHRELIDGLEVDQRALEMNDL